ncbi:MAG: CRTAC1 family protein [Verrucomicrobiales bacterium]|nr:CRTAC1 family protein [Verrucomicrobiales bacterium]MCP5527119.1 CRTAC1 family protein [Verrucomicrobiales bacterium]
MRCSGRRSWRFPAGCRTRSSVVLAAFALLTACDPGTPREDPNAGAVPSATPVRQGAEAGTAAVRFAEVTADLGIAFRHQLADGELTNIMESDGAGGVVLDYDRDGWPDVYFVNSGPAPVLSDAPAGTPRWPNRLYHNRGDGTFEDVTDALSVAGHGFGTTAAAADYDNDGDGDLLVVNFGGLILYRNDGQAGFQDVTEASGLTNDKAGISATFFDAEADGHLDLFVANYLRFDPSIRTAPGEKQPYPGPLAYEPEFNVLYRNRGDGTFEDRSEPSGIRMPGHRAMSVTPLDADRDGDTDLYVSNDGTANLLLRNDGLGHFKDVALECGVGFNGFGKAEGSMGACVGDANRDGLPDLLVTRFGNASLYVNSDLGFFEDRIEASRILVASAEHTGWGGAFLDFDNDGDLDIFIANGDPHYLKGMLPLLLENDDSGVFRNISDQAGPFFRKQVNARGCGVWDFDNDGWTDLVLTTLAGEAIVLRNETVNGNHYLDIRLEGTRSNRDGLGARVRVVAGDREWQAEMRCPTSYVFQSETRLHFGLGPAERVDRVEVLWPGGHRQTLTAVGVDRLLMVREPEP